MNNGPRGSLTPDSGAHVSLLTSLLLLAIIAIFPIHYRPLAAGYLIFTGIVPWMYLNVIINRASYRGYNDDRADTTVQPHFLRDHPVVLWLACTLPSIGTICLSRLLFGCPAGIWIGTCLGSTASLLVLVYVR